MNNRFLVIAPHADDETLGCGATIAKLSEQGKIVDVVIMTNASVGAPELYSQASIDLVRKEAFQAHKILGVTQTFFCDLPAPCLDQYPQYKISGTLSEIISDLKPETIFIPHRGDLHLDHGAIFNAALVAVRPQNGNSVKTILAYETLSETEWGHPFQDSVFVPNYFITVSEENLLKKIAAMSAFESQLKEFPHPRSKQAIESLARFRGATVGAKAAEAYSLVRLID